ncbi:MAG: hypothetical protein V4553_10685 [Bacteroidota bacterium]
MKNEFEDVMAKRTNAQLVAVLNSPTGDYQPMAMEAAKAEYEKRGLSEEQIVAANKENEQKQESDDLKANEPLSSNRKYFAAIFPGLVLFAFAGLYKAGGYTRKAKELQTWTIYGWCFYAGIIILLKILS